MTILRLFTFLFLFSSTLQSQTFNITAGKEFEDPERRNAVTSIDFNETNYYFLRSTSNDENLTVCNFDRKTGAIVYEKSIELKEEEEVDEVFNKNDKLLLFSSLVEKKADKKFYLLRVFDNKTGDMIGDVQVVEEVDTKDDDGGYRSFTISFSPDNKKMLTVLDDKNTKGPRRVIAKLYDATTFKKIWEKQPVENYEKSPIYASDFLVDDVGNFIYLIVYYRPGSSSENDVVYALCIASGNNTSVNFVKIPSENKTTSNITLDVFNNELICTGEFIDGNNTPKNMGTLKTTGFFVLSINIKETKLIAQSYNYLNEDLLFKLGYTDKNPLYPTNGIKKENKMFKHFKTFYYGGALYVVKYHGYDYVIVSNGSKNYFHHANEIIVLNYGTDKKLNWQQIIPRKTQAKAGPHPSYILQVCAGSALRFLYYDRDKNFTLFPDVKTYTPGKYVALATLTDKTFPTCTTIDAQGNLKREIITKAENTEFLNLNDNFVRTNSLILRPQFDPKKKTGRIDQLTFED